MRNKFNFLTKTSLIKKINNKWFKIINVILAVIILTLMNLDFVISFFGGDFNKETTIFVIDNTNRNSYTVFENTFDNIKDSLRHSEKFSVELQTKDIEYTKKIIEATNDILIVLEYDEINYINALVISNSYIDTILYQLIVSSINTTKSSVVHQELDISMEDLIKINTPVEISREFLDESKTESEENMATIMNIVFPTLILPFFLLVIFLVQMIGAEINEEKTTKSMEIIISNVSPKIHFFSKVLASNIFVIIQGSLLLLFSFIGFQLRRLLGSKSFIDEFSDVGINLKDILNNLSESGFIDKLIYVIPLTIILFILSFIAYSLLAGILASMTTNMEDFQQIQIPIMILSLSGYYLAMMSAMFEGALFIRIASYIPFISALLAPALLVIGQIGILDILLSIIILLILLFIMTKYGLKIYKVGILNYSSSKLWTKMLKAAKE